MRHGSNSRRPRGRGSNGSNNNNNNHHRRNGNPKVQTFDSNGPDVRIRGNAHQITEKYTALARDATSAGDAILAESYYQHAEHYQRMINEFMSSADRAPEMPVETAPSVGEPVNVAPQGEDRQEAPSRSRRAPRSKKFDTVDA